MQLQVAYKRTMAPMNIVTADV